MNEADRRIVNLSFYNSGTTSPTRAASMVYPAPFASRGRWRNQPDKRSALQRRCEIDPLWPNDPQNDGAGANSKQI
jgi:hypothetical protein